MYKGPTVQTDFVKGGAVGGMGFGTAYSYFHFYIAVMALLALAMAWWTIFYRPRKKGWRA